MVEKDLSKKKDESDLWTHVEYSSSRLRHCVKIHRSTQNKISKLYLIDRFARKIGDNFGFFLFLMIKRENIISKRCERSSVISACPFVPDTRHAYFVLIYFSSINCSTCCSLIHDASTFSSMKPGKEEGRRKEKKKKYER